MIEGPVLVTALPANTAKEVAVPKPTVGRAADATDVPATPPRLTMAAVAATASTAANQRRT
jgi:hypothetical protein